MQKTDITKRIRDAYHDSSERTYQLAILKDAIEHIELLEDQITTLQRALTRIADGTVKSYGDPGALRDFAKIIVGLPVEKEIE